MKTTTLYWTQEQSDWEQWDSFLQNSSRGIYLQTHTWLQSYLAYGFQPKLLLSKNEQGELLGGIGCVLASVGPLKVMVAPCGPILSQDNQELFEHLVLEFKNYAKSQGAFLAQITSPATPSVENPYAEHLLSPKDANAVFKDAKKGLSFKYVTGISAFRAIKLFPEDQNAYEKVRANYKSATRRDVNKSGRMGNVFFLAVEKESIKKAYNLIELNAKTQGYAVRSWEDFSPTLISMISKKQCFIACCRNGGEVKGALIIFDVGRKLHYIMGATLREKKDLMVGHFLQDQVIQMAIEKGYDFYDISMGGSPGVVKFKEGFGGEEIELEETHYWVLKPMQFLAYRKLLPWVQKNKVLVANLLSKFK